MMEGQRYFYLEQFSDEIVPCDCTLEGWAAWLSEPHTDWFHYEVPGNGAVFHGYAMAMLPDILATCREGTWVLSRPVDGDFVAIRRAPGEGWDCEDIVDATDQDLLHHLSDYFDDDAVVHVAVGRHEAGWRFTYHAGANAHLTAERSQ